MEMEARCGYNRSGFRFPNSRWKSIAEAVTKQLQREIDQMGPRQKRQLLEIARVLAHTGRRGTAGHGLARFAGSIPDDDLRVISSEIESGCEQVSADES